MQNRAQKRVRQTRVNLRSVGFFAAAVLLIGLVGWLYLLQASEVAGYAHEIRELQRQKEQVHRQIVVLEGQVAEAGSLGMVMQASGELGCSIPDALDAGRRLRLGYAPLAEPTPGSEPAVSDAEPTRPAEDTRLPGVFANLIAQVKLWLETPPGYTTTW
ncbi:MAG: hypothetical protein GX552_00770 [Chloroflexi bacterium]|nr:hypothetical protein [Chloroflexota bacterium]